MGSVQLELAEFLPIARHDDGEVKDGRAGLNRLRPNWSNSVHSTLCGGGEYLPRNVALTNWRMSTVTIFSIIHR